MFQINLKRINQKVTQISWSKKQIKKVFLITMFKWKKGKDKAPYGWILKREIIFFWFSREADFSSHFSYNSSSATLTRAPPNTFRNTKVQSKQCPPTHFLHQNELSILYICYLPNKHNIFFFVNYPETTDLDNNLCYEFCLPRLLNLCECNANSENLNFTFQIRFLKVITPAAVKIPSNTHNRTHVMGKNKIEHTEERKDKGRKTLHENDLQGHPGSLAVVCVHHTTINNTQAILVRKYFHF